MTGVQTCALPILPSSFSFQKVPFPLRSLGLLVEAGPTTVIPRALEPRLGLLMGRDLRAVTDLLRTLSVSNPPRKPPVPVSKCSANCSIKARLAITSAFFYVAPSEKKLNADKCLPNRALSPRIRTLRAKSSGSCMGSVKPILFTRSAF